MAKRTAAQLRKLQKLVSDAVIVAFERPEVVLSWIETLQHADSVGRVQKSKMPALIYGLYHYALSRIRTAVDLPADMVCTVILVDDQALTLGLLVMGSDGQPMQSVQWPEVWPEWLFEFFDDEDNEAFLHPSDKSRILEVTATLHKFCIEAGYLKLGPIEIGG